MATNVHLGQAIITNAEDFNDEQNPTIYFNIPSNGVITHLEAAISSNGEIYEVPYETLSVYDRSHTFVLTDLERDALRASIDKGSSRAVYFILRSTIDGVKYTSQVSRTFSLINHEPSISATIIDTDSRTTYLTGDNTKYISGFSDMKYTLSVAAKKEATIESYYVVNGGNEYYELSRTIPNLTYNTFYLSVTDSRGITTSKHIALTGVSYTRLTTSVDVQSLTPSGTLTFNVSGNYFNKSFGARYNTLELEYGLRDTDGNITWNILSSNPTFTDYTYSLTHTITGLDPEGTYSIQVRAIDELMNVESSWVSTSAHPIYDWSKEDFRHNTKVYLANNKPIRTIDRSGNDVEVLNPCNQFGVLAIGKGGYDNESSNTQIYGKSIDVFTKQGFYVDYCQVAKNILLWQGREQMTADTTIYLNQYATEMANGIVLVFSGASNDSSWNTFFISKWEIANLPGLAHTFLMGVNAGFGGMGAKYLYISDTSITGQSSNTSSGNNSGITFDNSKFALRYVIGV